jgi:hypothetical protein
MPEPLFTKQIVPRDDDPLLITPPELDRYLGGQDFDTLRSLAWKAIVDMGCPTRMWCDFSYEGHWFRARTYRNDVQVEALHVNRPGAPSVYSLPDCAA